MRSCELGVVANDVKITELLELIGVALCEWNQTFERSCNFSKYMKQVPAAARGVCGNSNEGRSQRQICSWT